MAFSFNADDILQHVSGGGSRAPVAFAHSDVQAATTGQRVFTPEQIDGLRAQVAGLPLAQQTQLVSDIRNGGISDPQRIAGLIFDALQAQAQQTPGAGNVGLVPVVATVETARIGDPAQQAVLVAHAEQRARGEEEWRRQQAQAGVGVAVPGMPVAAQGGGLSAELANLVGAVPNLQFPCLDCGPTTAAIAAQGERGFVAANTPAQAQQQVREQRDAGGWRLT